MEGRSLNGSFGEGFADQFSSLGDVLSCEIIRVFNINLVDLIGFDFFLFGNIHEVDFACVVAMLLILIRMNDEPSSSMKVLVTDAFCLLGEFKFEISGREDMEGCGSPVLNDQCGLLGFGDYSAEPCE